MNLLNLETMKTIYTYIAVIATILFSINTKAINPILPQGIIYQLEINSTEIEQSNTVMTEYLYLKKVMTDESFKYQFGKFNSFNNADSVRNLLLNAGCRSALVLAYNDRMSIPVAQAISFQYENKVTAKNKSAQTISSLEVNYLLEVKRSGLNHYYSLAVPVNSIDVVDKILEKIDDEQIIEINADENIYSIGRFETFEEVVAARKDYIEGENVDVFIMAQITDKRINNEDTNNLALTIQSVVNELASK
jgi:hypothetical protein